MQNLKYLLTVRRFG